MTFFPHAACSDILHFPLFFLLINHLFFVARSTLERKQLLRLCDSRVCRAPRFLWKYARFLMLLSPLPPPWPPPPALSSHGNVGWLSQLASSATVWDVHPVLQSEGKWWQAYLPWRWRAHLEKREIKWKKREEASASPNIFLQSWNLLWEKERNLFHFKLFVLEKEKFFFYPETEW